MKGLKQPHSRRLFITTFPSWQEVGEWYAGLERERRIPTTEVRAKAEEITRGAKSDLERVQALYEYVSRNIRYVSLSFGLGRYQPHAASEVLTNQYGDCKDKATLFEALLEAIGLHGAPALISTESDTDQVVASPLEFDHAISFLEVDGREIWLDSTAGVAPFGYLFPQLRGKNALVVFPGKKAELRKTPESLPMPVQWAPDDWPRHPVIDWQRNRQALDEPFDEPTIRNALAACVTTSLRNRYVAESTSVAFQLVLNARVRTTVVFEIVKEFVKRKPLPGAGSSPLKET